jgi:hypothetical protein
MEKYVQDERPAMLHIVDNAISPSVLTALVEHPPGAPWYGFVRVTKELTDGSFCRALKNRVVPC